MGELGVIGADFSHDFGGKDENQDDHFQRGGKFNLKLYLNQAGNHQKEQGQHTVKDVLVVSVEKLENEDEDDEGAQRQKHGEGAFVFPQLPVKGVHFPVKFVHTIVPFDSAAA